MAFAVTARHTGTNGTSSGQTQATNSVTPTADSLILCGYGVQNNNHAVLPTLAAPTGGPTMTLIGKAGDTTAIQWADSTDFNQGSCFYYGAIGATPSAFAFTADPWSDASTGSISVLAVDVTGHNVASPIVRNATNSANVNPASDTASGTVTLGAAPAAGDLLVVFISTGADLAGAPASPTAGAGKTFTTAATITGQFEPIGIFYRVCDGTESATITCADLGQSIGAYVMVAAEIAPAGGGAADSGPNPAGSATALAGGAGSWVNPTDATGAANAAYAVWTAP